VTRTVMMLRQAGKAAAGLVPASLVAGLGVPALAALVFLATLMLAVGCCIISSDDRTDRVSRILDARRGNIRSPDPDASAISPPGSHRRSLRGRR
jgi:hypothetical protein